MQAGCTVSGLEDRADDTDLRITKLKHGKSFGKKDYAALDKPKLVYNSHTICDAPLEGQVYEESKKLVLDRVGEHSSVSFDQASQSVNDFNNLTETMGEPPYIQHLLLQVLTMGLEINKIVPLLPALHSKKCSKLPCFGLRSAVP